jgi:hydrogenase/urease accessory protein HupE
MITYVGLLAAFILIAGPALAHPPPLGIGGVPGGVLHPFFVPAHALAIAGLGLLIGQQTEWGRAAPFAAITALIVGLAAMTLGYVPILMSEALLVLALVTGCLVAMARPLPEAAGCGLGAAIGFAVALDSPPEVVSVREANLMLIGTGFGTTILLILAVEGASRLKRPWLRIGARILGSWIAASAILVLALRFAR